MKSVQSHETHPLLRHRNTISASFATAPAKLAVVNRRSPHSLELQPIKPAASHTYSSLKDLLPSAAAANSPKPKSVRPGPDIRIRNRLVMQAAWAYLQPMSAAPGPTGGGFFDSLCGRVADFIGFFCRRLFSAVGGTLRVVRIRSSKLQRSVM